MLLQSIRENIIEYGKKLIETGLTRGTGGNISVCDRKKNLMAITPSGIDYFKIQPEQVVIIEVETGKIVDSDNVPSSERDMHRIFYKYRQDVNAVVHTHSTFAATVSCLNQTLPAIHYLVAYAGVDVRCAPYVTYGTVELARNAFEAMEDRKACLLANHGLLTVGADLKEAFAITEQIEFCCELYCRSKSVGEPVILPNEEMEKMIGLFKNYGRAMDQHEEI